MPQQDEEIILCSNPDCSWNDDGKCVNGLNPPEECPTRNSILQENLPIVDETVQELKLADERSNTLKLQWGDTFSDENIHKVSYRYHCKLILVVGEPSAGKSTLYAALFDTFHKGRCGNYLFHSTKTPIGFERTCHLAREKSGGKTSRTERTKSYEFSYYHLSIRNGIALSEPTHFLFADVNGERFQHARDTDTDMRKLTVMSRADHIFFIADGGLLVDKAARHGVKDDVVKIISRAIQNNMFNKSQQIHLLITKWDEVVSAGLTQNVQDFLIEPIKIRFNIISNVIKIASRSTNDTVPPRTGIVEFLETCAEADHKFADIQLPSIKRQFQDFKYMNRG